MVKITIEYSGDLRTVARHGPSGELLRTDAPRDNQGKGEYFAPTDLVATALGTCMATTIGLAARRLQIDLQGLQIEVEKEMSTEPPRRISALRTLIRMPLAEADDPGGALRRAAEACPVYRSLSSDIEMPILFRWTTAPVK